MAELFKDHAAERTAPSKARPNEALAALAARADQEFAGIAGYVDLTDSRKLRLFAALLAAKRHFDIRETVKAIPKDTAAIALLDNVAQSIIHTAKFGETVLDVPETEQSPARPASPRGSKALRKLQEAGERWASQQRKAGNDLPNGFAPWGEVAGVTNYGADIFIHDFLRAARVMASIVAMAQRPLAKSGFEGRAVNFQNSPVDWLAGEKLPEIYSKTFGHRFTATPKSAHHADSSNGIKFVRAACLALGLIELAQMSDHTIKVHYQNARKGSSLGVE
jgi:hypothetical protein